MPSIIMRPETAQWAVLFAIAIGFFIYAYMEIRHAHNEWVAERDRYRALRNALLEAGIRVDLGAAESRKPTITIEIGVFCCEQGIDRVVHRGVPVMELPGGKLVADRLKGLKEGYG